jgi:hypothetical protein
MGLTRIKESVGYIPGDTSTRSLIKLLSATRVFSLLFITNMLFNINPGLHPDACNAISIVPLPANKSLWEATTPTQWETRLTTWVNARDGRPSLTYGDIASLHGKSQRSGDPRLDDLNDWYLNIDSFGTFVLMTATSI